MRRESGDQDVLCMYEVSFYVHMCPRCKIACKLSVADLTLLAWIIGQQGRMWMIDNASCGEAFVDDASLFAPSGQMRM